jgi:hypothetical protein
MGDLIPDCLDFTTEEVEYLTLKYLYEQKLQGRDLISQAEVMDWLGIGGEEEDRENWLRINDDGIRQLKLLRNRYTN